MKAHARASTLTNTYLIMIRPASQTRAERALEALRDDLLRRHPNSATSNIASTAEKAAVGTADLISLSCDRKVTERAYSPDPGEGGPTHLCKAGDGDGRDITALDSECCGWTTQAQKAVAKRAAANSIATPDEGAASRGARATAAGLEETVRREVARLTADLVAAVAAVAADLREELVRALTDSDDGNQTRLGPAWPRLELLTGPTMMDVAGGQVWQPCRTPVGCLSL